MIGRRMPSAPPVATYISRFSKLIVENKDQRQRSTAALHFWTKNDYPILNNYLIDDLFSEFWP